MAGRIARERAVVRGSGNVFSELRVDRAEEKKTKVRLATEINHILRDRRLTRHEAARLLRITQSKVSALANYRLGGFSVERLMHFLNALGCGVQIVISQSKLRRVGRTTVTGGA